MGKNKTKKRTRRPNKGWLAGSSATQTICISFLLVIAVGTLLLTLPIASRDGQSAGFFTGLFTATSSTCVTGLILVDTWTQWTLFGQAVILTMIQLGGLGFMTVITLVSFALHRRIGLSERLIMVSTLNLNDMDGVVRVVRHEALRGLPFCLETPNDIPGYTAEIALLRRAAEQA